MSPMTLTRNHILCVRALQLITSLVILVLINHASTHRGWWTHLTTSVILGVITAIVTLAYAVTSLVLCSVGPNAGSPATSNWLLRTVAEVVLLLAWLGSFISLLQRKGHDYHKEFNPPPRKVWGGVVVLVSWELLLFVYSLFLISSAKGAETPHLT